MVIDDRTIILIGLGVSVGVNCQPCVQLHVNKAKEHGISDEEIKDAITVGRNVKNTASVKFDDFIGTVNGGSYSIQK